MLLSSVETEDTVIINARTITTSTDTADRLRCQGCEPETLAFGADRIVGLDLKCVPMLEVIRAELATLCVVRGTALQLPFADAPLGAGNSSNALQMLPSPRVAIEEIGRCLRPRGLFTAFTFRRSDRRTDQNFQRRHEQTFNVRAFHTAELITSLTSAGLD
jgi:SAM-dependent methyltransferase